MQAVKAAQGDDYVQAVKAAQEGGLSLEEKYEILLKWIGKLYWILFFIIMAIAAYLCFYKLGVHYVVNYDEARHGISAYEMTRTKEYFVNTYCYSPDYWNLKPPLSFYGIILGFKLLGYNETGLRVVSAGCYFLLCLILGLFFKKRFGALCSLLGVCFLCCNYEMFAYHGIRAGDADSMFILFISLAMLCIMEKGKGSLSYVLSGLFLGLGFLTKSYHAGIFLIALILYLVISKEAVIMKWKGWAGLFISAALPVGIWAVLRYRKDGITFFKNMLFTDVLDRSTGAAEGHGGNYWYYIKILYGNPSHIYIWLILISIFGIALLVCFHKKKWNQIKNFKTGWLLIIWFLLPLLLYTLVPTKLVWYVYPMIIPLIMGCAILSSKILEEKKFHPVAKIMVGLVLGGLLVWNMHDTYAVAIGTTHGNDFQEFIKTSIESNPQFHGKMAWCAATQTQTQNLDWQQNTIFVAETRGDLNCQMGGISDFLENESGSIIFCGLSQYYENETLVQTTDILYESYSYVLLVKK